MAEIHRRTQGMPRLINAVCDNLLLTAFAMESRTCTMAMLEEVSADMRLTPSRAASFGAAGPEYPDQTFLRKSHPYPGK
jgi:hypothetical protein